VSSAPTPETAPATPYIPSKTTFNLDSDVAIQPALDPEDDKTVEKTGLLKEVWQDMGKSPEELVKYINLLGVLGGAESSRGKKTSNKQSSAKGDFQITDDTFVVMKRRFYRYLKKSKGVMNMADLKKKRPDMYKIMMAESPLDLSRKEQAALLTVHMVQSDIPLNNFLKSKEGSRSQADASRDVYKYWVRDFDGMVYGDNAHIQNWNNNLKYLKPDSGNYKYLGVRKQFGGLAPAPVTPTADAAIPPEKSPFVEPFKIPDGLKNIQRSHKKLTRRGITYDSTPPLKSSIVDPSLEKKEASVPTNQFNINGVVADLVGKYSITETASPFVDNTSKPLLNE